MDQDIVILDGARSAIGTFGGSLAGVPPCELAARVSKAALERAGVEGAQIGHVVFGHVINTEPRDMYLSRVAGIEAGVPETAPAMNVNRLCGSGAQAVASAVQALAMGDCDYALAGGAENMSRSPYAMPGARWGTKMGDATAWDMMVGALTDPFGTGHMGVTAENVAQENQITREEQDAFALESQNRAKRAIEEGRYDAQIVPIEVKVKRDMVEFRRDEHPKATTAEALAKLRPAFRKDGGSVTAGNASGLNDGAAAIVLARGEAAEKAGLKARARVLGYAHAGVRPDIMGIGPIPAVKKLLERTGLSIGDFDVDRVERGLRRAGARGEQGARARPGEGQPQRRGDRARPSDRRHRRDPGREGARRARAGRRLEGPRDHVHRRRPGDRAGTGAGGLIRAPVQPVSGASGPR
jgi:acetyl-CoA C-acetyltransferase